MTELSLTDQERAAFHPETTRSRALDYFYVFDNVPLQFIYRDKLDPGELTELERRNKAITETLWLDVYHQYLVANVGYLYFYRGAILQMVFLIHQFGAGTFSPPAEETREFRPTVDAVRAGFDNWMASAGWKLVDETRKQPARGSWLSLLSAPDRTVRIASLMPVGNQVLLELISTWTEDGILKETAWAVALIYDADGTVLQDRSYIDLVNWPSARGRGQPRPGSPVPPKTVGNGVMDRFYEYHKSRSTRATYTDTEKRNLAIIEGTWVDAFNAGTNSPIFQAERFRLQLPVQKFSCNLRIARATEAGVREAAPDGKMRLALTYAKGNQVAAEGVVSWTDNGIARESPFISFLLLDSAGKVIRERRYITLSNWPGADKMAAILGL